MTALEFELLDAVPERHPAAPTLHLRIGVRNGGDPVDALALRVRVQIEPWRRRPQPNERALLGDLASASPLQWVQSGVILPGFREAAQFDVPVSCTYDLQVAAGKYLTALDGGLIPLRLFFNGTIFRGAESGFSVEMLPWDRECTGEVPLERWQRSMDACFSGEAWVRMERATFDALRRYRAAHRFAGWDETLAAMLERA